MTHPSQTIGRFIRIFILLALLVFLTLAALANQVGLAAQGSSDEAQGALTDSMRAFLEDKLPPEDRSALSATPCVGGMADFYPCDNIDLMAFMPLSTFGAFSGNDSWGWTDSQDGKEYALMGLNIGTAFVDISDPENPIHLGLLPTHTFNSSWRDIKVYADHAFVVSEAPDHGMQVFDLTELRSVITPPVTFTETAHYGDFGSAHNIVINEESGYAYAVGTSTCTGGLHMVDISSPTGPTFAGCFSSDGYTHDAQCVNYAGPDADHQGSEICFNANEDTLTIVDVTNKGAPVQLSRTGYAGSQYTHQGWLTDDHTYFLLDDELDETNLGHNTRTRIWDVSDLDVPVLIDFHDGRTAAIDHNMYVHGGYAYQANYRSGISILDLADVANGNLSEVGYFDIYPSSDSANFNGAWNVYPYFDSGNVIISGIEQGLFIVRPTLDPDFRMDASSQVLSTCSDGSDESTVTLTPLGGYMGSVSLSALALPVGATPSFSDNPVSLPGSSDLTVTTSGVTVGSYPFSIEGGDGTITHTLPMTLTISGAAPGVPDLVAPSDGAVDVEVMPTFEWSAAAGSTGYQLEVATDPGFSNIVYAAITTQVSHQMTSDLDLITTYYWRVRAEADCGLGEFSASFSFTTENIAHNYLPVLRTSGS